MFSCQHMGYYLKRQKNKENLINQSVWANVLNGWSVFLIIIFQKIGVKNF